jgi:hypothetical protein
MSDEPESLLVFDSALRVDGSFTLRAPPVPTTPVVVSVPHAGVATHGFDETISPELDVRCDADLYVDRLYRIGQAEGPEVAFAARLSRFVCDLNRDPDDVSPGAVPEHRAPRNSDGRGFIWAVTTTGIPALSRPLSLDDWRARTALHATYHDALAQALARARDRFGFAILVDGHSMPRAARSATRTRAACAPQSCPAIAKARAARRPSRAWWASTSPRAATASRPTIPTRAASSPPTTAAPRTTSTPSKSRCAATST